MKYLTDCFNYVEMYQLTQAVVFILSVSLSFIAAAVLISLQNIDLEKNSWLQDRHFSSPSLWWKILIHSYGP